MNRLRWAVVNGPAVLLVVLLVMSLPPAPAAAATALILLAAAGLALWGFKTSTTGHRVLGSGAQDVLRVSGDDGRRAGCRPAPASGRSGTRAGYRPVRVPEANQNPGGDPDLEPGAAGHHMRAGGAR